MIVIGEETALANSITYLVLLGNTNEEVSPYIIRVILKVNKRQQDRVFMY